MRALFRSLREFVGGILHRAYYWGFALILDPGDIYGRMAPPHWWRPPSLPDPWPWVILAALVYWCAVLTYHELRVKHGVKPRGIDADMTVRQLFKYLIDETSYALRFDDFADRAEAVRTAIEDQMRMGRIAVWGREKGIGDPGSLAPIDGSRWTGNAIDLLSALDPDEKRIVKTWNGDYVDLRVNREQIEQVWPRLSRIAKWRLWLSQRFRKSERSGT